jgi:hypothetical protein
MDEYRKTVREASKSAIEKENEDIANKHNPMLMQLLAKREKIVKSFQAASNLWSGIDSIPSDEMEKFRAEYQKIEAQIAEVQRNAQKERAAKWVEHNQKYVDAYKKAMEEIALSRMTEQEREIAAVNKTAEEYIKAYKAVGKDTTDVVKWAAEQKADIFVKYNEASLEAEAAADKEIVDLKRQLAEEEKRIRSESAALELKEYDVRKKEIAAVLAEDTAGFERNAVKRVLLQQKAGAEILKISKDESNARRNAIRAELAEEARIDDEVAKKRHAVALEQWELEKAMAAVNAAAAVIKTMATVGFPWNIPLVIAQAAAGAAQLTILNANRPKMQFGGFVPGKSLSGDQVEIRANSGEAVLTPEQQRNFMLMADGKTAGSGGNVTMGDTVINISGNADSSTVAAIGQTLAEHRQGIIELLYEAERRGEIDHSRLAWA